MEILPRGEEGARHRLYVSDLIGKLLAGLVIWRTQSGGTSSLTQPQPHTTGPTIEILHV